MFEERWNVTVQSCVFPRNQVAHTDVLRERGMVAWRSNPTPFYWNAATDAEQTLAVRMLRYADSLVPLGRRAAASRALRASSLVPGLTHCPPVLWRLHCRRMVSEARRLREDETLHLWFHPHNIGANPRKGVTRFAELIDLLRDAAPRSARFLAMGDVVRSLGAVSNRC